MAGKSEVPRRLTPEVTAEIEKALTELAHLKSDRRRLSELIMESNDQLNNIEKRLKQVWLDVDSMLDATLDGSEPPSSR